MDRVIANDMRIFPLYVEFLSRSLDPWEWSVGVVVEHRFYGHFDCLVDRQDLIAKLKVNLHEFFVVIRKHRHIFMPCEHGYGFFIAFHLLLLNELAGDHFEFSKLIPGGAIAKESTDQATIGVVSTTAFGVINE